MTAVTALPYGRALTRDDLDALPDDGHRYKLLDGSLLVTPAPSTRHQSVAAQLFLLLHAAVAADHVVLFAPLDVVLADDTVLQPDLLVAPRAAFTDRGLPGARPSRRRSCPPARDASTCWSSPTATAAPGARRTG